MAIVAASAAMLSLGAYAALRGVYQVADPWALLAALGLAGVFGGAMSLADESDR